MASAVGLFVALAGPPAVAGASGWLGSQEASVATSLIGQGALWLLALAVLAITLYWERLPLLSVGLVPVTWHAVGWGLAGAAVLLYVATPAGLWLVRAFGLPDFEQGLSKLQPLPLPVLACAAVTAGVVEELLYRGYAMERLTAFTGSRTVGALLSLAGFSLAHLPFWGAASALLTLVAGSVLTALFLWRRNLVSNMLAHALTAMVQLLAVAKA